MGRQETLIAIENCNLPLMHFAREGGHAQQGCMGTLFVSLRRLQPSEHRLNSLQRSGRYKSNNAEGPTGDGTVSLLAAHDAR